MHLPETCAALGCDPDAPFHTTVPTDRLPKSRYGHQLELFDLNYSDFPQCPHEREGHRCLLPRGHHSAHEIGAS